ncbi:MAG: lysophospholipase [Bdellovibrionales bacterium]
MSQRFEGYFRGADRNEIFYQTWTPENPRGLFLITHGLAEHSECYHHVAKDLAEDNWQVVAWDLRGHGRSEGKRGYVQNLTKFIEDLALFVDQLHRTHPDRSMVLFGHSMGGLITTRYWQLNRPEYVQALSLSSPAFGLSVQVPRFKEALAKVAVKWVPTLTMYNEIRYEDLTRDEEMLKSHRSDTLRHEKISPGLFLSMLENFKLASDEADHIKIPVLMQLSGEDRIVSTEASRDLFEKIPNKSKSLIVYPDSLHEVFNDRERDHAIADLKKFINPFLGAQPS